MGPATLNANHDLTFERDGGVYRIMLHRPTKRNALTREMIATLESALAAIKTDTETRVVVIGGAGPAFCAGHDLGEMVGCAEAEYRDLFAACSRMMGMLRRLPVPVIARVHGLATGAGCQLVAACDMAVAAPEAQFATPGVKLGLFCTTPMVPLVRSIPHKAAMEMLMTGAPISAVRALGLGLVNRVVPAEQLDATIEEFTTAIRSSSPLTIKLGKAAFYNQLALDEPDAYERAVEVMTDNALRHDAQEGMSAFIEKRPPNWTGT